jgi:hypothetical protein
MQAGVGAETLKVTRRLYGASTDPSFIALTLISTWPLAFKILIGTTPSNEPSYMPRIVNGLVTDWFGSGLVIVVRSDPAAWGIDRQAGAVAGAALATPASDNTQAATLSQQMMDLVTLANMDTS